MQPCKIEKMSRTKKLFFLYAALQLLSIAFVLGTAQYLPTVVASHFDLSGQPNATLPRDQYIILMLVIMVLIPSIMAAMPKLMTKLPPKWVNLPHSTYWLAPERMAETLKVLQNYFLVLACELNVFFAVLYWLVMQAHRQNPPNLSTEHMLAATAVFLGLIIYGSTQLHSQFNKIPDASKST